MGKANYSDGPYAMDAWAYTIRAAGPLTLNAVVPHKGQAQDWLGKRVIIHPLTDDGQMSEQIADAVIGDICEVTASTDHIRSMDANITAAVDQSAKIRIGRRYRITTVDGADAEYVRAVEQATQATVPPAPATITTAAGEVARIHDHAILADSSGVWVLENGQWQPIANLAEQRRQLFHHVAIVNGKELRAYARNLTTNRHAGAGATAVPRREGAMDTDKIAELRGKLRDVYEDLGYAVQCRSEPDTAHSFLRKAHEQAAEITAELKQLAD